MYRIGHGFDVHPLKSGAQLVLGGVHIKYEKGLVGHSDADVVIHAVIDSILGAMADGDIGSHFPDTDPQYKGISSRELLQQIRKLMVERNFDIANLDITIHAEKPKLIGYRDKMRDNLAEDLETEINRINVKATTWEKLGYVGREEGIACDAVVLLENSADDEEIEKDNTSAKVKTRKTHQTALLFEGDEKIERRVKTKGGLVIYTDGASQGNPGHSGAGGVILDSKGKTLKEVRMYLGELTNNQAEYQALILALKEAASLRPESVLIKMDSELVVRQILGRYKVKDQKLLSLYNIVKQQLLLFPNWDIEHIPREENERADRLASRAASREGS
jgi:2-C-methyl-D-erythritol 2,4-cyclodiphosphate synthase